MKNIFYILDVTKYRFLELHSLIRKQLRAKLIFMCWISLKYRNDSKHVQPKVSKLIIFQQSRLLSNLYVILSCAYFKKDLNMPHAFLKCVFPVMQLLQISICVIAKHWTVYIQCWRKVIRRIFRVPYRPHNDIVTKLRLNRRLARFLFNVINHDNTVCSILAENYKYYINIHFRI